LDFTDKTGDEEYVDDFCEPLMPQVVSLDCTEKDSTKRLQKLQDEHAWLKQLHREISHGAVVLSSSSEGTCLETNQLNHQSPHDAKVSSSTSSWDFTEYDATERLRKIQNELATLKRLH
jgi:hypothetical protein